MYRQWQAGGTWRLGVVLQSAGRPAEAEFTLRQAVALYEKLLADYPHDPWFRSQLAYTCSLLGGLLRSTGRAQEGEQASRQAVATQEALAADFPDKTAHRSALFTFLGELAANLLQQGKHDEAAKVAEKIAETSRDEANARQTAAAVLARCVPLAEQDARLSEADRTATAKKYADRSRELGREAANKK
jgi:tetratricopeptide (TPR) repeat protein